MKKTIIALMALAGVAAGDSYSWDSTKDYTYTWSNFS